MSSIKCTSAPVQKAHNPQVPGHRACFICSSPGMALTGKLACSPCEKGEGRLPVRRGSP